MANADTKPVNRKRGVWIGLGLILLLVLVALFEPSQVIMGTLSGDAFFNGLPTRYWVRAMESGPAERDTALRQFKQGAKEAVPVLVGMLQQTSVDPEVRCIAAEELAKLGPDAAQAGSAMVAGLRDADPHVQAVCAASLPKVGVPAATAVPLLIDMLNSNHAVVCSRALSTYRAAAAPAVPILIEMLQDQSRRPEIRSDVARTLGKIGPDAIGAVPVLIANIEDPEPSIREHCAEALGDIGFGAAKDGVPVLIKALADTNTRVRRDSVRSLGHFGDASRAALPEMRKLLKDPEQLVRDAAKVAVKAVAPEEPIPEDDVKVPANEPVPENAKTEQPVTDSK